jgi:hypothetical protein
MKKPITSGELQDLWHYATAIRHGDQRESAFATASLFGRLELLEDAARTFSRIDFEALVNTPWEDVYVQLDKWTPKDLKDVEKIGQALLDCVNAECARQGIEGESGERPSHTDEA